MAPVLQTTPRTTETESLIDSSTNFRRAKPPFYTHATSCDSATRIEANGGGFDSRSAGHGCATTLGELFISHPLRLCHHSPSSTGITPEEVELYVGVLSFPINTVIILFYYFYFN